MHAYMRFIFDNIETLPQAVWDMIKQLTERLSDLMAFLSNTTQPNNPIICECIALLDKLVNSTFHQCKELHNKVEVRKT